MSSPGGILSARVREQRRRRECESLSGTTTQRFHDYIFPEKVGRYVYRRFTDGSILILESPKHGPYAPGREPPLVTQATAPAAWRAITAAIQARQVQKGVSTVNTLSQIAATVAASLLPARAGTAEGPYEPAEDSSRSSDVSYESPSIPWGPIAAGALFVGVLLALGNRR